MTTVHNSLNCCKNKQFGQDQICGDITVAGPIFFNTLGGTTFSTGTITNTGQLPFTVKIDDALNTTFTVNPGSVGSFAVKNFKTISVSSDKTVFGEYCISSRYVLK